MPYFRIMMQAVPPYPPECWAETADEAEIPALIQEMRAEFGADEPAKVMKADERFGTETVHRIDDPKGRLSRGEATGPVPKFSQEDHGAVMPTVVATVAGTCSQCGRTGRIATLRLVGLGQDITVHPCVECLFDIAAGTDVLPSMEVTVGTDVGMSRVTWDKARRTPRFAPVPGRAGRA